MRASWSNDKAKVEKGVLAGGVPTPPALLHLNDLNRELRTLLTDPNQRPFNKLSDCRASAFAELD